MHLPEPAITTYAAADVSTPAAFTLINPSTI